MLTCLSIRVISAIMMTIILPNAVVSSHAAVSTDVIEAGAFNRKTILILLLKTMLLVQKHTEYYT